ncbi:hypothetical protein ACJMK2_033509 [Sinanodonta woodiana]|uniref:Peptidase S1 domain-containing protein n=1 Tax=Sinanodonta woodiana TaxID=1069815 RepID=A0ABD3WQQ1_SINWO
MLSLLVALGLVTLVRTQGAIPCGTPSVQPITTRIVGGVESAANSWPYVTLVVDDLGYIAGSATILNEHVLVTSAQHFEGPGYSIFDVDITHWRVYAGEHNIHTKDPNERYYHIARVVLHPGYNYSSLENDIALIITRERMQFNVHVSGACLPDSTHQYTVGQKCYLPGWGSTAASGNEEVLNQVDLPILADDICTHHWPDFLPATEICAGYENGTKDFCADDIGSPLLCKDQSGQWYIMGIASSGGNCKLHDEPGVFEDVTKYSDWVKKTMEDAGFPYQP